MSGHSSGSRPANRLAHETSPYLLQHQFNPVNWFPWGKEAFDLAKEMDRPIFLSVGYSACHWCHVMERESFESEHIAEILNSHYVSIKVDREERPDVDQIYMTAVQLITRRGGWPMSVFMTPDGEPFYGGTYWPPIARMGMPGFRDILLKLHDYWVNKRDEVTSSAQELSNAIQGMSQSAAGDELGEQTLRNAMQRLVSATDKQHGGFHGAPKFPHPMDLRLLLRLADRFESSEALSAVELTLDKMAAGGIYDHLGGGFHRYSTDARWLVPHFEKMLYDNALLTQTYVEAWQRTGKPAYRQVVVETLDYVLREMFQPSGGFYSTQDADSEGEEGKFFVWTKEGITELLPEQDATLFCASYDVTNSGNWEGNSILNLPNALDEVASAFEMSADEFYGSLKRSRDVLFAERAKRIAPGRDDKVLVNWNGLMIAAAARAGMALGEPKYVEAAAASARFIAENMRSSTGHLLHSYKDGRARFMAYLDDYASYIDGLVELFQATGEACWIEWAVEFADQMLNRFADSHGGFYYTAHDHEELIARTKDSQDNATPSGNGMAATVLLKLARLCDRDEYRVAAEQALKSISGLLNESPLAAGQSLIALDLLLGPAYECVLLDGTDESADKLESAIWSTFLPRTVVSRKRDVAPEVIKHLFDNRSQTVNPQAYVCEAGACQQPVSSAEEMLNLMK
ncbi:MAG: thioredoxin domain-containing protein [Planctomycetaceae bacterium]|nr:thioredoxin domain-containing protein [Planctomycetaceae bacterium]MCA9029338.1 thioredoxin domain-containing protein [Planctomycetaceae bacterium]MCA9042865.1 thioredoxin domain-containing protein [Planctomycetaceae bacterium]MCB9950231.1 thioredoxin domain-containing protein [Planctomycetaceae bacterium]